MYRWRSMTQDERESVLTFRKQLGRPWHSPPHSLGGSGEYHLTAACYEHAPIIGASPERMDAFSIALFGTLVNIDLTAWCLLPNHYHLLVRVPDLRETCVRLGRLHGKMAFQWNGEENQRGRRVWHSVADRQIRNEAHAWASLNYIHHNPVHHGYVHKWQEWPWSSARSYLREVGPSLALAAWERYPVLSYGQGWDEPSM